MNKNGFTLIELLAVVVILGIMSLIAVPNVISIIDNNKKDIILSDARKLISQAKYQVNVNKEIRETLNYTFYFNVLNANNDIKKDPDGGNYTNESYVKYTVDNNGIANYCVYLIGSKRSVKDTSNSCVMEEYLFDRNKVVEN